MIPPAAAEPVGVVVEGLVVIALVLLAWRPRGGGLDPPAGQVERPPPASPTLAPEDDD